MILMAFAAYEMIGSIPPWLLSGACAAIVVTVFFPLVYMAALLAAENESSPNHPAKAAASFVHPALLAPAAIAGWAALFLVVPLVALHERLGVWTPLVVLWLLVDFARFDMEPGEVDERHQAKADQDNPFFGPIVMVCSPLAVPIYAVVAALEYGFRTLVVSRLPIPRDAIPIGIFEGAWWLVAPLAAAPVLLLVVDWFCRRAAGDDWLAAPEPRDAYRTWLSTRSGVLRTVFVLSFVVVPVVLFVTLGAYSPFVLALLGITPIALAADPHHLQRRSINYALLVPLTVPAAALEFELHRVLVG